MIRRFTLSLLALVALLALPAQVRAQDEGSGEEGGGDPAPTGGDQLNGMFPTRFGDKRDRPVTHKQSGNELTPARHVENFPTSIEIRVGQKVSYRGKRSMVLSMMNPDMAKLAMNDDGIITLVGKKEGRTELMVFSGSSPAELKKGPRRVPVRITPR